MAIGESHLKKAHLKKSHLKKVIHRLSTIIGNGNQGKILAKALAHEGISSISDIKKPKVLARLSKQSQANVLFTPIKKVPLSTAMSLAAEMKRRIRFKIKKLYKFEVIPVGSIRRKQAVVKDIDFLVVVPKKYINQALSSIVLMPFAKGDSLSIIHTYVTGLRRRSLILQQNIKTQSKNFMTDLFITTKKEKPYALYHYTGPASYNIRTRAHVKRKGWRLNQYGLFNIKTNKRIQKSNIRTEKELSKLINVTYRLPQYRE